MLIGGLLGRGRTFALYFGRSPCFLLSGIFFLFFLLISLGLKTKNTRGTKRKGLGLGPVHTFFLCMTPWRVETRIILQSITSHVATTSYFGDPQAFRVQNHVCASYLPPACSNSVKSQPWVLQVTPTPIHMIGTYLTYLPPRQVPFPWQNIIS